MSMNEIDNTSGVLTDIQQGVELGLELACEIATGYARISKAMGGRCPVDTGRLKNSISYNVKKGSGHVGSVTKKVKDDKGKLGSAVAYAEYQEAKNGFLVHSISDHVDELQAAFDRGFTK